MKNTHSERESTLRKGWGKSATNDVQLTSDMMMGRRMNYEE